MICGENVGIPLLFNKYIYMTSWYYFFGVQWLDRGPLEINSKLSDGDNRQTSEWFQSTTGMNEQNHC